jgi:acetyl esterase/lipase
MKGLSVLILCILLGSPGCSFTGYSKVWEDLNYAGDTLVAHRLDIYLPEGDAPAYPAVVIIYGSAFFGDDLKQQAFKTFGKSLLESGFAVVAINHRSSRNALFPAQVQDVKAAIRFIRARAQDYRIDPSFIGITGYSSGGHLATLAGTSGRTGTMTIGAESADLEGQVGAYTGYPSSVDAVVDWFGPIDFPRMDSCGSSMVHDAPDSPESTLIGSPIQENPDRCALANPISYIDAADPPFLIFHGDSDPLVPHCQSALLHESLEAAGVPSEFILVPGAAHGPGLFEKEYFNRMCGFFQAELKKRE